MDTEVVNPLDQIDRDLIELWITKKSDAVSEEEQESRDFSFAADATRFLKVVNETLVDVVDLQDLIVFLEYIRPTDYTVEDASIDALFQKIEEKIVGVEGGSVGNYVGAV